MVKRSGLLPHLFFHETVEQIYIVGLFTRLIRFLNHQHQNNNMSLHRKKATVDALQKSGDSFAIY